VTLPTDTSVDNTIDCGYVPPCTGTIGDFVWQDTNGNGCQDAGEPGIPNVQVQLFSGCGSNITLVATTTTDSTGHYLFTNLCAGSYTVRFTTPTGFTHTTAFANCSSVGTPSTAFDSNCNCTGTTSPCDVCVNLPANNSSDLTIDCGYICPCLSSSINNAISPGASFAAIGLQGSQFSLSSGPLNVTGNLAIGANGNFHLSGGATVNGTLFADPTATVQIDGGSAMSGGTIKESMAAAQTAAINLSNSAAALAPTKTFSSITNTTTITGNGGQNVILVTGTFQLSGGNLTIVGGPTDTFIINAPGGLQLSGGSQIILSGVSPTQVLFNFPGTGNQVQTSGNANTAGIFLAPSRQMQINGGTHNSEFISGGQLSFQSNPRVIAPPCSCTTVPPTPTPTPTPTPSCPPCVNPNLGLGAASTNTILELGAHQVSINGPAGGIIGNVLIAPNGHANFSGGGQFINGNVLLGPGAQYQNSGLILNGSVLTNQDLSAQITAAISASNHYSTLAPTQTFSQLTGGETITGVAGTNVIKVGNINISGKQTFLSGPANALFIINVTGSITLTGGGSGPQIRVTGGATPSNVIFNVTGGNVQTSGGGGGTNCCAAIIDGTILDVNGQINLAPGLVNGEIISGQDISIVSGSGVHCPACQ
jgi:hypothetical protein